MWLTWHSFGLWSLQSRHTRAPSLLPGALAVPVLQHCALSSYRLGLDGMKMQVKCCRSSAVTQRDPVLLGEPME